MNSKAKATNSFANRMPSGRIHLPTGRSQLPKGQIQLPKPVIYLMKTVEAAVAVMRVTVVQDSEDLEEEVITDDNFYFSSYDIM